MITRNMLPYKPQMFNVRREKTREIDFEGYSKKPYRGNFYGTWAHLEIDGDFTYASLSMLSSHIIFGVVEDFAFEEINKIIPYNPH